MSVSIIHGHLSSNVLVEVSVCYSIPSLVTMIFCFFILHVDVLQFSVKLHTLLASIFHLVKILLIMVVYLLVVTFFHLLLIPGLKNLVLEVFLFILHCLV